MKYGEVNVILDNEPFNPFPDKSLIVEQVPGYELGLLGSLYKTRLVVTGTAGVAVGVGVDVVVGVCVFVGVAVGVGVGSTNLGAKKLY
ncbi:MAG: hypothetical protein ACK55Z_13345, partial [bacterium]